MQINKITLNYPSLIILLTVLSHIILESFTSVKMVSLSFFDEHLAWQQRVQKEITVAHRFRPLTKELKLKLSSKFGPHDIDSLPPESRQQLLPNLGNVNVYAEVRGKYARPAMIISSELPAIRSKSNSEAASRPFSKKSSIDQDFEEIEGKTTEELARLLRQERLVHDI